MFAASAEAVQAAADANEAALGMVRNNPHFAGLIGKYGCAAIAQACLDRVGLPVPLVTTGNEVSAVIDFLEANRQKEN